MRIETNRPVRSTASRRDDRGGVAGSRFAAALDAADQPPAAGPTRAATPLGGLLSLQELPDAATGRRRAVARGSDLLDRLEELRIGLLVGSMPRERIAGLARLAKEAREAVDDPRLAELLDDIELRAAVELAKLENAA